LAVARAFLAISRAVMGSVVRRWIAGSSPAMAARGTGFCHPTGKSPGQLIDPSVQPCLKKYSDFPKPQISPYMRRPVPREGRFAIVTDAGRDAVDAGSAKDESAFLADGEVVWS
jgi:hypothetical protein